MDNLIDIVRNSLQIPRDEIQIIRRLAGMTNFNYLISVKGDRYVLRIPGNGTNELINRMDESNNLQLATEIGINPGLIYFNTETGVKITEKISNVSILTENDAKDPDVLEKVATLLRKLHKTDLPMKNHFNLSSLMETYEQLAVKTDTPLYTGFQKVKLEVLRYLDDFEKLEVKFSPCHIDTTYKNFLMGNHDELYLIDWEYSGLFDPLWDIANYSVEARYSPIEERSFLQQYLKREPTSLELKRMQLHKIFQDYLWSLWTLYKEAKGDNFGSYGKDRFERLLKNIKSFQLMESNTQKTQ